jgi:hypothetical protein
VSPTLLRIGSGFFGLVFALAAIAGLVSRPVDPSSSVLMTRLLSIIQLIGAAICFKIAFGIGRKPPETEPGDEE